MFKDKKIRKQSNWYFIKNTPLFVLIGLSQDQCKSSVELKRSLLSQAFTLDRKGFFIDAQRKRQMADQIKTYSIFRGKGYYITDGELYLAKDNLSCYIWDFVKRRRVYSYISIDDTACIPADLLAISVENGTRLVSFDRKLSSNEERFSGLALYSSEIKRRMSGEYHAE